MMQNQHSDKDPAKIFSNLKPDKLRKKNEFGTADEGGNAVKLRLFQCSLLIDRKA